MNFFKRISFLERELKLTKRELEKETEFLNSKINTHKYMTESENLNGYTVFNTFALIFGFFGAWTIKDNINRRINALENEINLKCPK